jgi:transmembrane sensor
MSERLDWNLLARYVSGEATSAERAEVERWASGNDERQALLASLGRRWNAAAFAGERDIDGAWARLSAKLPAADTHGAGDPDVFELTRPSMANRPWANRPWANRPWLLRAAAVIVLAIGAGMLWRAARGPGSATLGSVSPRAGIEVRTRAGERRTLDLSDGSRVTLGAASVLRVDDNFGKNGRHVYLDGQALFRVRHDAERRFVVHAAGTVSEDLGTEFDVRAYPGDSLVRVVVKEGAVAVHAEVAARETYVLRADDVALVNVSGHADVVHDMSVERLLAWTGGEIVFDDTPLSEVAAELQRWFDVEFRIDDSTLADLHFTTTKGLRSGSLDEVLPVIEASLGVQAVREGRVVTFRHRPLTIEPATRDREARPARPARPARSPEGGA